MPRKNWIARLADICVELLSDRAASLFGRIDILTTDHAQLVGKGDLKPQTQQVTTSSPVGVASLFQADYLIEVEAVAAVPAKELKNK